MVVGSEGGRGDLKRKGIGEDRRKADGRSRMGECDGEEPAA
jgi:hypothetical protein